MIFRLFTFTLLTLSFLNCISWCQEQEPIQIPPGLGSGIIDGLYSRVQLYDGGELRVVKRISLGAVPQALSFSPDDKLLAVENRQGIQFYAISGVLMGSVSVDVVANPPFYSSSPTIAFAPDLSKLLMVRDGVLNVWKLTFKPNVLEANHLWKQENVSAAAFSPDGKQILLCKKQESGFCLSLASSDEGTVAWTKEMGFTPAIQIVIVPDGTEARVLTCSVPNRNYAPNTLYDRALLEQVAATVATWAIESGQMMSSIGIPGYYPAPIVLSPSATFVFYQALEGAAVVDASTGTLMRSNIQVQGHIAISDDESTFASLWALARFSQYPHAILESPNVLVYDSSRHQIVAPSALSSDATYWAVTAAAVPLVPGRYLSSPVVLIWQLAL